MPQIQAPGLVLRPFEERDAPQFTHAVRESVETVGHWMPWCHAAYTEADALDWFRACHAREAAGRAHEFGMFTQAGNVFIGGTGLNQINHEHAFCNLGYWVRQRWQRQGVASSCVRALAAFGFQEVGLYRIEIVVAVGNEASAGVARKAGAVLEGVARNRLLIRGEPVAAQMYALVPDQSGS